MCEIRNNDIICFHLLNDYSGSANVLSLTVNGLKSRGYNIELCTSGGVGALTSFPGIVWSYDYRFSNNPIITFLRYSKVQCQLFKYVISQCRTSDAVFFINTVQPIGAAVAAKLCGKTVIYHYHENASIKGVHYRFLARIMQAVADDIICVSAYQASLLKRSQRVEVIPNALPQNFVTKLRPDASRSFDAKSVLMLSSLKIYKGIRRFVELAKSLPEYRFTLVISDTSKHIEDFFSKDNLSGMSNLKILPLLKDVSGVYNDASIVVNLSDSRYCIETFGMTVLEAMSCGLPVIVPKIGGISEMVEDNSNGYKIDGNDIVKLVEAIRKMLSDKELYAKMSYCALKKASEYSEKSYLDKIERIINRQ